MEKFSELKEICSDLLDQTSGLDLSEKTRKLLKNVKTTLELDPLRGMKDRTIQDLRESCNLSLTKPTSFEVRSKIDLLRIKVKKVAYYDPSLADSLQMISDYRRLLKKAFKRNPDDFESITEIYETLRTNLEASLK